MNKAVILFSGGRDSSVLASYLASKGYELHLLLCDNGASSKIDLVDYRIKELRENFPTIKIKNKLVKVNELFRDIALKNIESDMIKYHSNLICMGCKLAMISKAICYAIENNIDTIATGFVDYESDWPEQMPEIIFVLSDFVSSYNLHFVNPLFWVEDKKISKSLLLENNLSTNPLEPNCLFGDTFSIPKWNNVRKYINDKLPIVQSYIDSFLRIHFEKSDCVPEMLVTKSKIHEKRIIILSHCLLNLHARAKGVKKPFYNLAMVDFLLPLLRQHNCAIIQLPCPEIEYDGLIRQACGIEEYDNDIYKKHCGELIKKQTNIINQYIGENYTIVGVVGVNGSPSCGIDYLFKLSEKVSRKGVFMKKFHNELINTKDNIPFVGLELSTYSSIQKTITKIQSLMD